MLEGKELPVSSTYTGPYLAISTLAWLLNGPLRTGLMLSSLGNQPVISPITDLECAERTLLTLVASSSPSSAVSAETKASGYE
jgi:hypothetical protein